MNNQRLWLTILFCGFGGYLALTAISTFIWLGNVGFTRGLLQEQMRTNVQDSQYHLFKFVGVVSGVCYGFCLARNFSD